MLANHLTKHLIIGTRGSRLALVQSVLVADALKRLHPQLVIETKIIKTTGDIDQSPIPLDTNGKNWFTAEIEQALMKGEIDLAVHSLKDMALESVPALKTIFVLERADPRDVLVSKGSAHGPNGPKLDELPKGAVVGTDSVRRKMFLLERRPDLVVKSIRGNVDSRIKKLHAERSIVRSAEKTEQYDAIVIAAAGLERLGMLDVVTEFFDPTNFLIAPGQGILAAQTRADHADILELLESIEHASTRIAARAELAFARAIGGGCKLPMGCYAEIEGDTISFHAATGNFDDLKESPSAGKNSGKHQLLRKSTSGPASHAVHLAEELAKKFPKDLL